jgi:hypothetical protein
MWSIRYNLSSKFYTCLLSKFWYDFFLPLQRAGIFASINIKSELQDRERGSSHCSVEGMYTCFARCKNMGTWAYLSALGWLSTPCALLHVWWRIQNGIVWLHKKGLLHKGWRSKEAVSPIVSKLSWSPWMMVFTRQTVLSLTASHAKATNTSVHTHPNMCHHSFELKGRVVSLCLSTDMTLLILLWFIMNWL